jgi:hypothetical protein
MHGADRVLVRNPNSGDGRATKHAKRIAADRGYDVRDSDGGNHTAELAERAARDGAALLAACGGDGTLNKVVRGAFAAGGGEAIPDGLTLGVVPAGTGNDFTDNVGVRNGTLPESDAPFDAVELNGKHPEFRSRVGRLARRRDLPIVAGSDAHFPFEVGRASTRIDADELTPGAVTAAIRDGRVEPVVRRGRVERLLAPLYDRIHREKGHL